MKDVVERLSSFIGDSVLLCIAFQPMLIIRLQCLRIVQKAMDIVLIINGWA